VDIEEGCSIMRACSLGWKECEYCLSKIVPTKDYDD
jgi:hypothetical protein